jgi:glucans biosynthesis protein C
MNTDSPEIRKIAAPTPLAEAWAILWDARGLLALLGIILHSARIYAPQKFAISDPELHILFRHLVDLIHAFRMEGFFALSGAALFIVAKRNNQVILSNRTSRLLIPFLFTALLLNLPILQLCQHLVGGSPSGTSEFNLLSTHFWLSGDWVMHLWFIRNLMLYTFVFWILSRYSSFNLLWKTISSKTPRALYLPIAVLALLAPNVLSSFFPIFYNPLLGTGNGVLGTVREHLHYGLYFSLGLLIAAYPQLLKRLVEYKTGLFLTSLALCALCLLVTRGSLRESEWAQALHSAVLAKVFIETIRQCCTLALIYLSLQIVRYLRTSKAKASLQRWAKASYTIYLVHQPVVWLLALGLQTIALPIAVKFVVMVWVTLGVCMAFDRILVLGRIGWTSFMFTGKRLTTI